MIMIDYAKQAHKEDWFRHPVIGDPSFDTFRRYGHNPVHRGTFPFEWPVNGSLFRDPVSGRLYMYISLYYKGYWSIKDPEISLHCIAYRSDDDGATWQELGLMLQGTKHSYDGEDGMRGGAADMCVVYDRDAGVYHALFGWATSANTDGGIGYASAPTPEGPWVIGEKPVHRETEQELMAGKYKRVYASSLIRRERDWLIIAMTSTPRNWGGTWGFVSMTAERPEGPYSAPQLLLYPQSATFHPPIVEFFPAFEDEKYVYAPFTSLAVNRNFQVIYRAEKEQAHLPEAWHIHKYGSVWHAEDLEHEKQGIWGQTFAGLLESDGRLRILYPAKTDPAENRGTINFAECEWDAIDGGDGFYLSAPNGPALTFIQGEYGEFVLEAHIYSGGEKSLLWAYNAPIGPDIATAGASLHPLMLRDMLWLQWANGRWNLNTTDARGDSIVLASGTYTPAGSGDNADSLHIVYASAGSSVRLNGVEVWCGQLEMRSGKIGLLAGAGSNMRVDALKLDRSGAPCRITYLGTEGLIGSGCGQTKPADDRQPEDWTKLEDSLLRFGVGYRTDIAGSRVKWNYAGGRFQVWGPRGSTYGGVVRLYLDGEEIALIDLQDTEVGSSTIIYESGDIPHGYHAVTLELVEGALVCDSFDFWV